MKQPLIAFLAAFAALPAVAQQHQGHGTPPQSAAAPAARADSAYGSHRGWQDPQLRPWRESNAAVAAAGPADHQHGAAKSAATPPAGASPAASHDHGDMKAHMEKMKAAMKDGKKGDMKGEMKGDMKAHHEAMHKRMQAKHGGTPATPPASPAPSQPGKSDGAHKH